jgi:predicted nuclease of predicted toxin-antitoxin system
VRWLIDEMLPPTTATELLALGHDASGARELNLAETADELILDVAVAELRVLVTENFSDFARLVEQRHARELPCVPVVFVRKRDFPRRGALASHLARHLHRWAEANPDPYPGVHWPQRS